MNSQDEIDLELQAVVTAIQKLDPDGSRIASVLRNTLDQLYDGQRTGRYKWEQLYKTEKTHCGTLVEINLHREFDFENGDKLDYRIGGFEVDCKYSQRNGGWMIPPEAQGHLCLLVWAEDQTSQWSIGVVRTAVDFLNTGSNRDSKATLNSKGRDSISWLFDHAPLPPNILLQLDPVIVEKIMELKSGQKRINELFRNALGMRVARGVVATVAQQPDYMKRVRRNGGARTALKSEGIVILGQYNSHCSIARALEVPVPTNGESVPVRIVPATNREHGVAEINGQLWRLAKASDRVVSAPELPAI
jgi:hypothetical protein